MASCEACSQPLVLQLDPDDFDEATSSAVGGSPSTVPDDLELSCGCHFHWQCLLDTSPTLAVTLACPSCSTQLVHNAAGPSATNQFLASSDQKPHLLTRYTNEGGVQPNLDILPLITEEAYLDSHPSARPARAYLTMCAEGDVGGIVELLQNLSQPDEDAEEEAGEEPMSLADLLRYQDPLNEGKSALHVAVEKGQMEIVWLLLWVASRLEEGVFPEEAVSQASVMGAGRELAVRGDDLRSLKDEQGWLAGDLAFAKGGIWRAMVEAGIFGN